MWTVKEDSPTEMASTRCAARARELLRWLHRRPEPRIAVVTHWVFLTHLFALFDDEKLKEPFGNAEVRRTRSLARAFAHPPPALHYPGDSGAALRTPELFRARARSRCARLLSVPSARGALLSRDRGLGFAGSRFLGCRCVL